MKLITLASALLLSATAFSADFIIKIEDINCTIKNGKVVRTQKIGTASFTETKTVSFDGFEPLVAKAAEISSEAPVSADAEIYHQMIHEGKTYTLNVDDSKESQVLVRLTSRVCR